MGQARRVVGGDPQGHEQRDGDETGGRAEGDPVAVERDGGPQVVARVGFTDWAERHRGDVAEARRAYDTRAAAPGSR